ncbi:glutathione S-transferase family protein [Dongia sp.]|uniref:glutathione S-transferase family protein n=1 Tax=Dongia sp. TaxID=1977262 RepID=UPI0035B323F3
MTAQESSGGRGNELTLIVGSKNYSSWSLRPFLALKATGLPFREVLIPLRTDDTYRHIRLYSPSGLVPVLLHGDIKVWETLAICEYIAELAPDANLWPKDREARAFGRSIANEMHAGFAALRQNMPMDLARDRRHESRAHLVTDQIARIADIWNEARERFGRRGANGSGPFLLGGFSIADAMFAPVATRFRTYGVKLDEVSQAYCEAIFSWPGFKEWEAAALQETAIFQFDVFQKAD